MKNLFFLILGLLIILGSIFLFFKKSLNEENLVKIIKINDVSIEVEIADTIETRMRGLSYREFLANGRGMFFIFDKPSRYGFWMKDMHFAIDIVWIDERFRVIDIEKSVSPETFPKVFYPNEVVKYVLELDAGFSDEHSIDIGKMVYFD